MKKLVAAAILALSLGLGGLALAQDTPVRPLGGGFETRTRVDKAKGTMILVRFPVRCRVVEGTEAEFKAFDACGDEAVKRVFRLRRPVPLKEGLDGLTITVKGKTYKVIAVVGEQGELAGLGFVDLSTRPQPQVY